MKRQGFKNVLPDFNSDDFDKNKRIIVLSTNLENSLPYKVKEWIVNSNYEILNNYEIIINYDQLSYGKFILLWLYKYNRIRYK